MLTRLVSAQATPENVVPKSMPMMSFRSFKDKLLRDSMVFTTLPEIEDIIVIAGKI